MENGQSPEISGRITVQPPEQPAVKQAELIQAKEPVAEKPQRYTDQLPEHLKKKFFNENRQPRLPDRIDRLTQGQREVSTLVLLEWMAQEGKLPPGLKDPENNVLTIELSTNPPKIKIDGSNLEIVKITGVEGKSFVCIVKNNEMESQQTIAASQVIEAQKKIVEESEQTGIIKASALKKFLETAKEQLKPSKEQEGQPLPEDKKQQLDEINNLIVSLKDQLTPDQTTFVQALRLVLPSQQPVIEQEIDKIGEKIEEIEKSSKDQSSEEKEKLENQKQELEKQKAAFEQVLAISQQQTEELITQWVEKVYSGKFSAEEIDKINDLLETGNIDSIQELLGEKDGDSEETKQAKSRAARVIRGLKEKGPLIGGVFGILLLLMILKASNSGSGQNQMMG